MSMSRSRCALFLLHTAIIFGCVLSPTSEAAGTELELEGLDGSIGTTFQGIAAGDRAGSSVTIVADLNGDGLDEVVIGAPRADPGGRSQAGEVYVVFGVPGAFPPTFSLATLDGTNGFRIEGVAVQDRAGSSVAAAGDVNDDGIEDLVIGATEADPGGRSAAGEAYVVFGRAAPYPAVIELSSLDGTNGFTIPGIAADDRLGTSVAGAGDVNDDGIDDVILGAPLSDRGGFVNQGESYVIFGLDTGFGAVVDPATLDGTDGFAIRGRAPGDQSGTDVAGVGDLNNDGIEDVLLGAPEAQPSGFQSGEAYAVFGSAGAFPAIVSIASLGTAGLVIEGENVEDRFGSSVAAAGDVDGDGIADALVSAPGPVIGVGLREDAYILFGSSTFPAVIDADDGTRLVGPPNTGTGLAVAGGADLNGDGVDDVVVARLGGVSGGYVVYGNNDDMPDSIELDALDGRDGYRMRGIDFGDQAGTRIACGGDTNGDGFADFLLGAPRAEPGGPNSDDSGEAYLVLGAAICKRGSVNAAAGPTEVADVLFVNGTTGDAERAISVNEGDSITASIVLPPAGSNGKFVVHMSVDAPDALEVLPATIGFSCLPFLFAQGASPVAIWNNAGKEARIGSSEYFGTPIPDPDRAPTEFLSLPLGDAVNLPAGTTMTLQGASRDNGSLSVKTTSATNVILLRVL